MIDINKYEGHSPAPWKNEGGDIYAVNGEHIADTVLNMVIPQEEAHANTQLIADAPLLLAEVKRLRDELALYEKYDICHPDGTHCCDECLERNGFEVKE